MNANEVRTEAGLVVPASAVQRKRKVLSLSAAKLVRRYLLELVPEGIIAKHLCNECGSPVQFVATNRIVNRLPGGQLALRCNCSDWVVQK
jgi:hypothetical protein